MFDACGAAFWTGTYAALGYLFADQLDRVALHVARVGALVALGVAAVLSFYVLRRLARWLRFVRQFQLARITPEQLRDQMNAGTEILLVDLQRQAGEGIPGAVRIHPRVLERCKDLDIPAKREVVLYCTCPSEFTSARVALALRRTSVITQNRPYIIT